MSKLGSGLLTEYIVLWQKDQTIGLFQPTLVLVGTRLGLDGITPVYWSALKAALNMPQSVGIAG